MFRTFARTFLPNRLDWMLRKAKKKEHKSVLLCWNRGLGDIALGVAAIVHRIRSYLPDSTIHVLTRDNLRDGFSMLQGIHVMTDPAWKRGSAFDWRESLAKLGVSPQQYDLVLASPSPTDWCRWQHKTFIPKLTWNEEYDSLVDAFDLPPGLIYIGVQVEAETGYGLWRNWPHKRWQELFDRLQTKGNVRALLFGMGKEPVFSHPMIIDLRGKTNLFELLSIIKNRCHALILPDSGILSMSYYLNVSFPLHIVSLWGDPRHGILKQGVSSPNRLLVHTPLIGNLRDPSSISAERVYHALFPKKVYTPLQSCAKVDDVMATANARQNAACVILAGGQGSRLGCRGPKGMFSVSGKTLFQHLVEKVPCDMPVAIMTSAQNHQESVEYFQKHNNFGRSVLFFEQESIALLDEHYRPVAEGPNGNGSLYRSILAILDAWEVSGIDTLVISPVDNPLADPADMRLLAFHRSLQADVTIQCVERKRNESMGALGETQGRIHIVEYFDIMDDPFCFSYTGQVALSSAFVRKAASLDLPFHWVNKQTLWKRERLLFDAFSAANAIAALCYPRHLCYAPIKTGLNEH